MPTPAERSAQWVADLPNMEITLQNSISDLPLREYTSTLFSFLKRMMKQPAEVVRPHLDKRIPTGDGYMTVQSFLVRMSREVFYSGFEKLASEAEFPSCSPPYCSPPSPIIPSTPPVLDWIEKGEEEEEDGVHDF